MPDVFGRGNNNAFFATYNQVKHSLIYYFFYFCFVLFFVDGDLRTFVWCAGSAEGICERVFCIARLLFTELESTLALLNEILKFNGSSFLKLLFIHENWETETEIIRWFQFLKEKRINVCDQVM